MASVGINKVILAGNLGKDPEVRHLEGGAVVANFPLATTEYYKDKNGNKVEQTEWHNIVLWRAQAEYAEKYLKKGFTILVEGKLKTRAWEDKDKNKRYTTEIYGDSITILIGNRRDESNTASTQIHQSAQSTDASSSNSTTSATNPDDLPF
ncbi:MAG TPA: single-stranded DNA-binding protein [Bacteroidia bacterium]|nr:single-stranded DNA-binding protein [Bacteroidia bacterium]